MMKRSFLVLAILYLFINVAISQSPYEINWKKEALYIGAGIGTMGLGAYLRTLPPVFTSDAIESFNSNDVNAFDRFATGNFSTTADSWSDVFWFGSHLTPALFLTNEKTKSHFGQIMAMYGEVATITLGVTVIIKSTTRRTRPFVFNPDVPEEMKLKRNARTAFLSGHTSMTAVNTFFAAKVFSDFFPDSKWKHVIWGTATAIPAITGYLRVAAGKHYPTDVIAGYALGAGIGILVPHLHKNKKWKEKGLSLDVGYNSARLVWNFK